MAVFSLRKSNLGMTVYSNLGQHKRKSQQLGYDSSSSHAIDLFINSNLANHATYSVSYKKSLNSRLVLTRYRNRCPERIPTLRLNPNGKGAIISAFFVLCIDKFHYHVLCSHPKSVCFGLIPLDMGRRHISRTSDGTRVSEILYGIIGNVPLYHGD